ncbi:MAG: hypothetical protein ABWX57_11720, partial [Aeromicrobium sp.]
RTPSERRTQRARVLERMRSDRMSPLPGPGVFATSSSNATPALLPDGSIAPESLSPLVEQSVAQGVVRRYATGAMLAELESGEHPRRPDSGTADEGPTVVDMPVVTSSYVDTDGPHDEGERR